jgi:hypothetical protein
MSKNAKRYREPKKGTQKNKEKESNPWAPKPIKPMEPIREEFMVLEGNLLDRDLVATNVEIEIRENTKFQCQLVIHNSSYSQEETLAKLNNATSHIKDKLVRFSPDIHAYIIECTYEHISV